MRVAKHMHSHTRKASIHVRHI